MGRIIEVIKKIFKYFKERGVKDITWKSFKVYLSWVKIKIFGARIPESEILAYSEQLVWRTIRCQECVLKGKCISTCGCDTPEKMYIKDAECELKRWGPMLATEEWKAKKQEDSINFLATGK